MIIGGLSQSIRGSREEEGVRYGLPVDECLLRPGWNYFIERPANAKGSIYPQIHARFRVADESQRTESLEQTVRLGQQLRIQDSIRDTHVDERRQAIDRFVKMVEPVDTDFAAAEGTCLVVRNRNRDGRVVVEDMIIER